MTQPRNDLRLVATLVVALIVLVPLVFTVWEEITELLAGRVRPARLGVAIALVPVLLAALVLLGRTLNVKR